MFLLLTSVSQDIRKAEASSSSGCVHKPSSENIGVFGWFLIMKVLGGGIRGCEMGRDKLLGTHVTGSCCYVSERMDHACTNAIKLH